MKQARSKTNPRIEFLLKVLLLAGLAALLAAPAAWSAGTQAGTPISNRATINYSVGTVGQMLIESSPEGNTTPGLDAGADTRFVVDNRVNLVVASLGNPTVIPGQSDRVLAFTVTNTGNTTQGYAIEVVAGDTGIVMTNIRIYRDVDNNGQLNSGDILYTAGANIGDLDPNGDIGTDDVMRVLIVADVPAVATDGSSGTYWLRATTLDAGTTTVTLQTRVGQTDDPAAVDVVFGDPADSGDGTIAAQYDGRHAASAVYTVATANLSVQKTVAVIEDEILGASLNAKAIPGATVLYTITIFNAGSQTAAGVRIDDTLDANVTYAPDSVAINGSAPGDGQVTYDSGSLSLTVDIGDIDGEATSIVTFRATIN